eukprot:651500-Pelagomonas_calceolata.AAC.3
MCYPIHATDSSYAFLPWLAPAPHVPPFCCVWAPYTCSTPPLEQPLEAMTRTAGPRMRTAAAVEAAAAEAAAQTVKTRPCLLPP